MHAWVLILALATMACGMITSTAVYTYCICVMRFDSSYLATERRELSGREHEKNMLAVFCMPEEKDTRVAILSGQEWM